MKTRFLMAILLILSFTSFAAIEITKFDDPVKEDVYKELIEELRCLVCQNQNLADSNAELAQDMRRKTFKMVDEGASHDEVVDFMVKRYGDFVLYRPPFKWSTALLWIGPFVILGGGLFLLLVLIKGRGRAKAPEMSESDLQRARTLLGEEGNNS